MCNNFKLHLRLCIQYNFFRFIVIVSNNCLLYEIAIYLVIKKGHNRVQCNGCPNSCN